MSSKLLFYARDPAQFKARWRRAQRDHAAKYRNAVVLLMKPSMSTFIVGHGVRAFGGRRVLGYGVPGGKRDPADDDNPLATALREYEEETHARAPRSFTRAWCVLRKDTVVIVMRPTIAGWRAATSPRRTFQGDDEFAGVYTFLVSDLGRGVTRISRRHRVRRMRSVGAHDKVNRGLFFEPVVAAALRLVR